MKIYAAIYQHPLELRTYFFEQIDVSDSVVFTTELHGGFGSCSFEFTGPGDFLITRYRDYLNAHVVLYDAFGRRLYEGFVTDTRKHENGISVKAAGYYSRAKQLLHGNVWTGTGTTAYDVIDGSIDLVSDWNKKDPMIADATIVVGPKDYSDDQKVSDALEDVLKYGFQETDDRALFFAIWEHRVPYLFPEPYPWSLVDWHVSKANVIGGSPGISLSMSDVANKIYVRYDDPAEDSVGPTLYATPAEDTLSQNRYGVKEGVFKAGQFGLSNALKMRDAALERYKYPRQVFTATIGGYIKAQAGFYDYPYRIRAGQLVLVTDMEIVTAQAETFGGQAGHGLSGFVLKTSYNGSNRTLDIHFGSSDNSFETLMGRLGLGGGLG